MRSGRRVWWVTGAAVTALVVVGCARVAGGGATGSSSGQSPADPSSSTVSIQESNSVPSPPATAAPLRDTTWYFTSRTNNDLRIDQAADPDAWIRFGADSLTFNGTSDRAPGDLDSPCPTWTAGVAVASGTVTLDNAALESEGSITGCGTRFLGSGTTTATVDLRGRTLSVHADDGQNKFTFSFSADPPAEPTVTKPDLSFLPGPATRTVRQSLELNPLRGRNFLAESISGRTLAGKGITLQFGIDQVGLSAGCNGGGAGYTVQGDTITFTPGAWTAMACEEKGVMAQELWLTEFASGTAQFSLQGKRLTITRGSTVVVLAEDARVPSSAEPAPATYLAVTKMDEIVDSNGNHPLPQLEPGQFWYEQSLTLSGKRLVFDVGCGQYIADFAGSLPNVTLPIADGAILHDCPPIRTELAAALRYILSGPVTIDRDSAFVTFTGRDGLQVTAHSGYQSG